jgi:hypothetical protein
MSHQFDLAFDHETPASSPKRPACCSLARFVVPGLVLLTAASCATAAFFAGRSSQSGQPTSVQWESLGLPPISATASVVSEKYSMATGFVSEDVEGLFVLDHNSGLLQCNVIYPRAPQMGFMGVFTINVAELLGTGGKGGQYMMVTGVAQFQRSSNQPAAETVVYVMDTATGNFAGYGIPFNRAIMNSGKRQVGALVLLTSGSANPIVDRDNLR